MKKNQVARLLAYVTGMVNQRLLLQTLEDQEALILVPTVALAEYLVIYPPEHHGQITAELNRTFLFPPCDVRAASIAAEIWDKHRSFKKVDKVERAFLKGDALIVATAKAAGADVVYSNDSAFLRLDAVELVGKHLPTHHEDLFVDHQSRKEEH